MDTKKPNNKFKKLFWLMFITGLLSSQGCIIEANPSGTAENPLILFYDGTINDDFPYSTSSSGDKFFKITGLTSGAQYYVDLIGLSDNVDLYVYSDNNFSVLTCQGVNPNTGQESCLGTAAGTSLYLKTVYVGTGSSANYQIDVY